MRGTAEHTDRGEVSVQPARMSHVGPARAFVRSVIPDLGVGGIEARHDDIVLVASELFTNAVEHGAGGDVTLELVGASDRVELSVASDSSGLGVQPDAAPSVDSLAGRGLFIVAALSDDVRVARDGDLVRVTCSFHAA